LNAPCLGIFPVVPKVGRCNRAADDRLSISIPELTRRRDPNRANSWLIYYADVHICTVARSVGNCAFQRADSTG